MNIQYQRNKTRELANMAIVAGIYVVVTFITAPFSFGPLNFRVAEAMNFLGLYNKRHIYALTLGVFISNYFAFGPLDMIVGSLSTLTFVFMGRWTAIWIEKTFLSQEKSKQKVMLIKYATMAIVFSTSMITIAIMIKVLGYTGPFLPLYGGLVLSELVAMILGGFIVYPLSHRIDLTK